MAEGVRLEVERSSSRLYTNQITSKESRNKGMSREIE